MDIQDLEEKTKIINQAKDIVIKKIIDEGYMSEEEGLEFIERCHLMVYKGSWLNNWFKNKMKNQPEDSFYMRIVELSEKQTSLDDLIRRTANGK